MNEHLARKLVRDRLSAEGKKRAGRRPGRDHDTAADWAEHVTRYGRKWLANVPAHLLPEVVALLRDPRIARAIERENNPTDPEQNGPISQAVEFGP